MSELPKGIFVTGTDTGVGKTVVSAAIAWTLQQSGRVVAAMKPIQTGTSADGLLDIDFVQRVAGTDYPLRLVCPYRFSLPLAPLVAAKFEGEQIDVGKISSAYSDLLSGHDAVVVEGAGGLVVPINENYFMADLALDLELGLIIVTRPGLGTLNHTVLTVEYARSRGLNILGFVINDFPPSPEHAERTNPELLLRFTGERLLGVIPHDPEISVEAGATGSLKALAGSGLAEELGGKFSVEDFIAGL